MLFIQGVVFSQNNRIIIKGLVVDVNNHPISNANISILNTLKGTSTNNKGVFNFSINKGETNINISHISYYLKSISLNYNDVVNDTLRIKVHLNPKVSQLSPFVISSEKIELLYNKPFIPIYDYQFYYEQILLLLKEENTTKLKLIDNNQKVAQELVVGNEFKSLFKDCFGNLHCLSNDSAYQLQLNAEHLFVEFKCSRKKFNKVLEPCAVELDTLLLFKQFGRHNQSVAYFYFNEKKEKCYLSISRNKDTEYFADRQLSRVHSMDKNLMHLTKGQGRMSEHKVLVWYARDVFEESVFYTTVLLKPLYTPLFQISNVLYLFDHPNNSCYVFDENLELKTTIPIDYHLQKKWAKELILDKEQGDVYAKFEKNGLCYLKKIDLTTGKIIESFKLEKHTYPTNIKIKNNTAYYLYKNHFNHGQMSLYKQGLY